MTLFDRYIAVDWSAANSPQIGVDSIWVAELGPDGARPSVNPPTRSQATTLLVERIRAARAAGERVMVGLDFVFGYPRGAAEAITGKPGWRAMWQAIAAGVEDGPDNRSNRFELAARFNRALEVEYFWGHPHQHVYPGLTPRKPLHGYVHIPEHRLAERYVKGPQPSWKLTGAGSVGSQTLLGIARLQQIREAVPEAAVWPFETTFEQSLAAVTLVEIYPTMFPLTGSTTPKDREQVEISVARFAALDAAGRLGEFLSAPAILSESEQRAVLEEEGWIAGAGHEHVLRTLARNFLRDPDAIYVRSFAIIEREADLSRFTGPARDIVVRMIHACGMTDIASDIRIGGDIAGAAAAALASGAPILCDAEAVRSAIIARNLDGNELIVTLNHPSVPDLAQAHGTTRSAAAIELWRHRLAGAVVVIGNAPTALFRLLELLEAGAPRPAAIIAAPVGFVGAAESKAALTEGNHGVPFVTLLGRRGGSAIAAAALNAIAKGAAA